MRRLLHPETGKFRDFNDSQQRAFEILLAAGWKLVGEGQKSLELDVVIPETALVESGIPPATGGISPLPKDIAGYRALVAAGIYTLDVLRGQSENELALIPGIGKSTARKIALRVELHYANRSTS